MARTRLHRASQPLLTTHIKTGPADSKTATPRQPFCMTSSAAVTLEKDRWSRPVSRVLSRTIIPLGPPSPVGSSNLPGSCAGRANGTLFGLAPSGVYRTGLLPDSWCALTAPFHPYHALLAEPFGGLLSVALAVSSRRPGVTWHSALWSPDFPPLTQALAAIARPTPARRLRARAHQYKEMLPGRGAGLNSLARQLRVKAKAAIVSPWLVANYPY